MTMKTSFAAVLLAAGAAIAAFAAPALAQTLPPECSERKVVDENKCVIQNGPPRRVYRLNQNRPTGVPGNQVTPPAPKPPVTPPANFRRNTTP